MRKLSFQIAEISLIFLLISMCKYPKTVNLKRPRPFKEVNEIVYSRRANRYLPMKCRFLFHTFMEHSSRWVRNV